jgi:hypothetical protein
MKQQQWGLPLVVLAPLVMRYIGMMEFYHSLANTFESEKIASGISEIAREYSEAKKTFDKATIKTMTKVIALCSDIFRLMEAEYSEASKSGDLSGFMDKRRLNIMQRLVDLCMSDVVMSRAMALLLIQADQQGYSLCLDEYLDEQGGLSSSMDTVEFDLFKGKTRRRYSPMGKKFLGKRWASES